MRENDVASSVPTLICHRHIAHIARLVAKRIVDSVKGIALLVIVGESRDVIMVSLKRITPFIADGDTASAIVAIPIVIGVGAALNHCSPNRIDALACHAVSPGCCAPALISQATAGARAAISQATDRGNSAIAAVALAEPFKRLVIASYGAKCHKAAKSLVGYIFGLFGQWDKRDRINHSKFSFQNLLTPGALSRCRLALSIGFFPSIIPQIYRRPQQEVAS